MPFPFVIRKLTKVLRNEQIIAARGADRFAPSRVKELTEAIELLKDHQATAKEEKAVARKVEAKRTLTLKEFINQIPLFN